MNLSNNNCSWIMLTKGEYIILDSLPENKQNQFRLKVEQRIIGGWTWIVIIFDSSPLNKQSEIKLNILVQLLTITLFFILLYWEPWYRKRSWCSCNGTQHMYVSTSQSSPTCGGSVSFYFVDMHIEIVSFILISFIHRFSSNSFLSWLNLLYLFRVIGF